MNLAFPVDDLEFKINATFLAYCKVLGEAYES